jgi:hypothetical protein
VQPLAILNHAHGVYAFRSVNLQGLPDGEYQVYTTSPAAPAMPLTDVQCLTIYEALSAWAYGLKQGYELPLIQIDDRSQTVSELIKQAAHGITEKGQT